VLEQHPRSGPRERQRRLALLGLELDPFADPVELVREADRGSVDVTKVDVLPPEAEQLALAPAHVMGKTEDRRERLPRRRQRLPELVALIDPPFRRRADRRPLVALQQLDRVLTAPAAVAAGELEHAVRDLEDAVDARLGEPDGAKLTDEPRGVGDVDRVHAPAPPAWAQVVDDVRRVPRAGLLA
jgi:hypothetical protein